MRDSTERDHLLARSIRKSMCFEDSLRTKGMSGISEFLETAGWTVSAIIKQAKRLLDAFKQLYETNIRQEASVAQ